MQKWKDFHGLQQALAAEQHARTMMQHEVHEEKKIWIQQLAARDAEASSLRS